MNLARKNSADSEIFQISPFWRGHMFLFDQPQAPTFSSQQGTRLLLLFLFSEVIVRPLFAACARWLTIADRNWWPLVRERAVYVSPPFGTNSFLTLFIINNLILCSSSRFGTHPLSPFGRRTYFSWCLFCVCKLSPVDGRTAIFTLVTIFLSHSRGSLHSSSSTDVKIISNYCDTHQRRPKANVMMRSLFNLGFNKEAASDEVLLWN